MIVEKIGGVDKRLYELIGPLVMNPQVIAFNNNYPFKTSLAYTWFAALDGEEVNGFVPVKQSKGQVLIDNYYTNDHDEVLPLLIESVVAEYGQQYTLTAIVHCGHKEQFARQGFTVKVEWKRYFKMDRPVEKLKEDA